MISVQCLYAWCDIFISILGLCSYLTFDTPVMVSIQCVCLRDYFIWMQFNVLTRGWHHSSCNPTQGVGGVEVFGMAGFL